MLSEQEVKDAAASFQNAVVRALVNRTIKVAKEKGVRWIAVGGGVSANSSLREEVTRAAGKIRCRVAVPPLNLCTDNAVMIAVRAQELYQAGEFADLELDAIARVRAEG